MSKRRRGGDRPAAGAPAPDAADATIVSGPVPRSRAWHAHAAIALVWAVLFAPQLFLGQVFTHGDARNFRPFSEYSRERWLTLHERTLWNPFVFGGISAAASLADARPQYLPDLALDAFERLRPSNVVPLAGPLLAHLAGMLAAAALARALWRCGPVAMAIAGLAWGLGPELLVPLAFGHDAQLVSFSLLPVVLLAIHHVCAAGARAAAGAALGLALVAGVLVLTGHPQVEVLGALLAAAFAIERALHFRRPLRLAWVAGAGLLALAIGAAVWLPAMRYSAESFRGGGGAAGMSTAEVTRFSFALRDLLALAWPNAVGFGGGTYWGGLIATDYPRYLGVVTWLLACGALVRGRREAAVWVFAGFAALAIVSSLGTTLGAAGDVLRAVVPMSSRFRVPTTWIGIAQLGLALLAARALAPPEAGAAAAKAASKPHAASRRASGVSPEGVVRPPRRAWSTAAVMLVAAVTLVGPLRAPYEERVRAARPKYDAATAERAARNAGLDLALRAAVLAAAATLLWRMRVSGTSSPSGAATPRPSAAPPPEAAPPRPDAGATAGRPRLPRGAAAAGVALAALAALDIATVSWPVMRRATGPLESLMAPPAPELAKIGARETWARVSSTRDVAFVPGAPVVNRRDYEFYSNDWIRWRARTLGGTHGAPPALWRIMSEITRSYGALCAFGVTYMSSDPGAPWNERQFEPVFTGPRENVYRLRGALGRAYAVPEVVTLGSDVQVISAMMAPGFHPARVAFASVPGAEGVYPGSIGCRIAWIADEPDRVALEVDAAAPAFVVLADGWFPGWRARIDGRETPLHRVNQLVRGVAVPGGRHRVEMRFEPQGWRTGVRFTNLGLVATLVLALAWAAWTWRVARRPAPAA